MMGNTAHARALWSQQAWCGHRIEQKPMWFNRKSERENGGRPGQMSKWMGNAHQPYSPMQRLWKGSGKPLRS